jgi:diadenosine tetraphosphate (Ap4A) HIT family hydrolase
MDCYTCKSISGKRRISPGPTIHESTYWVIEHAYPCGMKGWLVVVLKRHAEVLHELSSAEMAELGQLLEKTGRALHEALGCKKEYVALFAEGDHFNHVHFHVVARPVDMAPELKGPAVFKMLSVAEPEVVPPEEIKSFCEELQGYFQR